MLKPVYVWVHHIKPARVDPYGQFGNESPVKAKLYHEHVAQNIQIKATVPGPLNPISRSTRPSQPSQKYKGDMHTSS